VALGTYLTQVTITFQVTADDTLSEKDVADKARDLFRQGKYADTDVAVDVLEQLS
jgi:hypothetical protein